ncbi:MAG: D-alanyl-D-alanine carboxypeptidase family protein [Eubacteriales bacterium]
MKKRSTKIIWLLVAFLFTMSFVLPSASAVPQDLELDGAAAVLMEQGTNRVLYAQNENEKLAPASTTKVMTCILAIENGDLDKVVTVSKNASGVEGSSIWLSQGEHITLGDLLYGLMLSSGNDAAVAIAEEIGGSVDGFVEMMNNKAKEIGALNTNFANPNGLPDDNHYTTAYDLALICSYAMQNETFRTIVSTEYKEISWEGHEYLRVLKNKNKLLWQYDGCTGIKTGYTKSAGKCLTSAACRDGMGLVAVVLNDGDLWEDCRDLLDYGFENYKQYSIINKNDYLGTVNVKNGTSKVINAYAGEDITYPLTDEEYGNISVQIQLEDSVDAPVEAGRKVGEITIKLGDEVLSIIPITAKEAIPKNTFKYNLEKILNIWYNHIYE